MKYLNLACRVAMLVVFVPVAIVETWCSPVEDWLERTRLKCRRRRIKIQEFADRKFPVHQDE